MSLCWIASYPKSGNTWLRFFLYAYYRGEIKSSSQVEKFIPDIHAMSGPEQLYDKSTMFAKSHFKYSEDFASLVPDSKAIYIIRNPKSVLLSNLNYFKIRSDRSLDEHKFAKQFIENKGVPLWVQHGMGNWSEHIESWLNQNKIPILFLQYEKLKSNPEKIFTQIIEFIDQKPEQQIIKQALQHSSFECMKALEQTEKKKKIFNSVFSGTNQSSQKGLWFMRSGNTKESLDAIDPELDKIFDAVFEPYLEKYNLIRSAR